MIFPRLIAACVLVLSGCFLPGNTHGATEPAPITGAHRVLFLGDSITYSGLYMDYFEAAFRVCNPDKKVEFINLGLPSETVSGLSEPGHAGGAFPRPDLHDRLDRALEKIKPDVVFACYGMNDGIYYPFGEDRFAKFQEGVNWLHDKVTKAGARIIHVTPPTFDPLPLKGRTLPAGLSEYKQPYEGYDEVLKRYSKWLVSQQSKEWEVIDVHTAMASFLSAQRRYKPEYQLANDGVHAGPTGHWLIAEELLFGARVKGGNTTVVIDLGEEKKPDRNDVKLSREKDGVFTINWTMPPSSPLDPAWDEQFTSGGLSRWYRVFSLSLRNLDQPMYDVFEGDSLITTLTRQNLRALSLGQLQGLSIYKRSADLLKLLRQKNQTLTDAWLTDIGHKRPGMAKGLPLDEAQKKAAELEPKIEALTATNLVQLTFKPSHHPFPGKKSEWNGYERYDYTINGHDVMVIVPKKAAPGKPWVWHGEFFGHKPDPDIALLGQGYHIVYTSIPDMLGCPAAVSHWDLVYRDLTGNYGLGKKVALVGLSRGALYCYNWAETYPDRVACIYADAPVCDLKSWPGGKGKGKGSPRDWQIAMARYGFKNEAEALAYPKNPVDNLAPLARAKVPLLHVYGDADDVVPWEENTRIVAENYRKLGGDITLIAKPGVNHHPHGLTDSTPIIEFIRKHCETK